MNPSSIHQAARWGLLKNVQKLLCKGVSIDDTDHNGMSVLYSACDYDHQELVQYLLTNGADVDIKNTWDETALHIASYEHFVDIVKLLLDYGADVNIQNKDKDTPLHYAVSGSAYLKDIRKQQCSADIVIHLLNHNADIYIKNDKGETPIELVSCPEVKMVLYRYRDIDALREWRPWNHCLYPVLYRQTMITLALLAKAVL